jgi:hypothetical protein
MSKLRMRLLALTIAVFGLGAMAAPANAMYCTVGGSQELSDACNQVIAVVCTGLHKYVPPCL